MFAYSSKLDGKYFKEFGVPLKSHHSSKIGYCNAIIQILLNIERTFSHDLYVQIYEYSNDDKILKELKKVIDKIREVFIPTEEDNKEEIKHPGEERQEPKISSISTEKLVKAVVNQYKDSLELKNKGGKLCFMEILLMKYHQLFKKELECSFIEFSSDRTCVCPIHSFFGMSYIDIHSTPDTLFQTGNRFCIHIDIFGIINKLKDKSLTNKEGIPKLENKLFQFFQNFRSGKDLVKPIEEYCVQINGEENAKFLTFKIEFTKKAPKNYFTTLAQFLAMMPQNLQGDEFQYVDQAEGLKLPSPTGKITSIVTHYKDTFASFIKIEGSWVYFSNESIKKIGSYTDVIST